MTTSPDKMLAEWFWTDRWMGSSAFLLPLEPRGLYREMLTQAWRRGARLPADHEAIRRAVGCSIAEWKRCWPAVERYWRLDRDGYVNDTQVAVYGEAQAKKDRASSRGRKGALARAQALAQAKLEHPLKAEPPSPSPSPSSDQPSAAPPERTERAPRAGAHASRGMASGPLAGMLPRDHLNCRQPCVRVCLSERQHAILRSRFGGSPEKADQALDAFYAEVRAGLDPDVPIGERPWEFWDRQFAARYGSTPVNAKTAGNLAAAARFAAREQS